MKRKLLAFVFLGTCNAEAMFLANFFHTNQEVNGVPVDVRRHCHDNVTQVHNLFKRVGSNYDSARKHLELISKPNESGVELGAYWKKTVEGLSTSLELLWHLGFDFNRYQLIKNVASFRDSMAVDIDGFLEKLYSAVTEQQQKNQIDQLLLNTGAEQVFQSFWTSLTTLSAVVVQEQNKRIVSATREEASQAAEATKGTADVGVTTNAFPIVASVDTANVFLLNTLKVTLQLVSGVLNDEKALRSFVIESLKQLQNKPAVEDLLASVKKKDVNDVSRWLLNLSMTNGELLPVLAEINNQLLINYQKISNQPAPFLQLQNDGRYLIRGSNIYTTTNLPDGGFLEFPFSEEEMCRIFLNVKGNDWSDVKLRKGYSTVFENAHYSADKDPWRMLAYFRYDRVLYGLADPSSQTKLNTHSTMVLLGSDPGSEQAYAFIINDAILIHGVVEKVVHGANMLSDQILRENTWNYLPDLLLLDVIVSTEKGNMPVKDKTLREAFGMEIPPQENQ